MLSSLWVGGTLCVLIAGLFNVLDKHIGTGEGVERRVRGGKGAVKEKKLDFFRNKDIQVANK